MERRQRDFDSLAMAWLEHGEGRPVVLVHGVPTSPELWRHVMPRLAGVRAIAWEMPGYGGSIAAGRQLDLSIACQAERLARFIKELGIERPILAGHDLGGGVIQILAVRRPELAGGLFLTNSVGYDNWPVPSVKALRAAGPLVKRMPAAALRALLLSFYHRGHDDRGKAQAAYRRHAPFYLAADGAAALERQIAALDVRDTLAVSPELARLAIPARIVWGAADGFLKIDYGERFARDLKAPLRRIEGGRHFIPEDHPEIVAEELQKLVDAVAQAEPARQPDFHLSERGFAERPRQE